MVSPRRLVHYRDNWYLDGWCRWRNDLRSLSVDAIHRVKVLRERARNIAAAKPDAHYSSAQGILASRAKAWAVLRLSAERAPTLMPSVPPAAAPRKALP
jgi:predicted DNA-binding transcriptional regulator YafY